MLRVTRPTTRPQTPPKETFLRRALLTGLVVLSTLGVGWIWTSAVAEEPSASAEVATSGSSADPASDPGALSPATKDALLAALDDERRSRATYRAVIDRHGEVPPFARIVEAEGRHEAHLLDLFESYGLEAPADPWGEREIEVPDTVAGACREGVESEKANVALYERLLASEAVTQIDVRELFGRLRDMSRDHHLEAFTRCVERGGVGGPGMGHGRGPGGGMGRGGKAMGPGRARAGEGCGRAGGCEGGCSCGMCRLRATGR